MSNELIKVREENGIKLVNARELYIGLGLDKSQWSRWSKKNIINNDFFSENNEWVRVRLNVEGNEVQDFAITLDFAKHLAMMARSGKSHEFRNYFIECEKQLMQVQPKLPTTYKEALLALVEEVEKNEQLQLENKTLTKEVEYKEDVIIGLTKDITLQEKRQRLGKIVKHGVRNPKNRWNMLYDEFDKKFHIDTKRRYTNALERGEIKKSVNRLGFICANMNMTNEIYDVACKIYEGDFIELLDEWRNNIAS